MATRGFLIRFIDIGLIVLFGFLMISDIEASSRVELAGASDSTEAPAEPDAETGYVVVRIAPDGSFVVGAPDAPPEERVRLTTVERLSEALERVASLDAGAGRETLILIEPHPASAVQRTVDVMDVADALGIPKSLQMDIEIARPDPSEADTSQVGPERPSEPDTAEAGSKGGGPSDMVEAP